MVPKVPRCADVDPSVVGFGEDRKVSGSREAKSVARALCFGWPIQKHFNIGSPTGLYAAHQLLVSTGLVLSEG